MAGFEPAISRPPAVRFNQAELHSVVSGAMFSPVRLQAPAGVILPVHSGIAFPRGSPLRAA